MNSSNQTIRRLYTHKLALGTVQLGFDYGISNSNGQVSPTEATKILKTASNNGVLTLDTARGYGNSEEIIAKALPKIKIQFRIVTKIPSLLKSVQMGTDPVLTIKKYVDSSFNILQKNPPDTFLFHDENDLLHPEGLHFWKILEEYFEKNIEKYHKTQKIGVSCYSPESLVKIIKRYPINVIQVPYNILDRRFFSPLLLELYQSKSIEIHIRSVFLQGLFFLDENNCPNQMAFALPTLLKLKKIGSKLSMTSAQLSLCASLCNPWISKTVIGVTSVKELEEILDIPFVTIDKKILDETEFLWKTSEEKILDPRLW